jgi:quercetin dioxygenase-like cupin family protein
MDASMSNRLRVVQAAVRGPDVGLVDGGSWREIIGPATGAEKRSLYDVCFGARSRSVYMKHVGEAVYYVVDGTLDAVALVGDGTTRTALVAGSMVHIRAGGTYSFEVTSTTARIVGGPCPVDPQLGKRPATPSAADSVRVFHRDQPGIRVPFISRDARFVVWLGVDARDANMNFVVLEPGESNKEHVHRYSEDTVHILEGHGTAVNVSAEERVPFGPGDTVHIDPGCWHAIHADRGERVVSVGGPCPADLDMLRAAGVDVSRYVTEPEDL